MSPPEVVILGAYRVEMTPELLSQAMEMKYGDLEMSAADREEAERQVREELSSVLLFEVRVTGRDGRFKMSDFGQEGSDQAAYDEAFLSADGSQVVATFPDVPEGDSLRIAFYLHFFDTAKPLRTSYGEIPVPEIQSVPPRLAELVPYEPVD